MAFVNELDRNRVGAFSVEGIYEMAKAKLQFDVVVSAIATSWCCIVTIWLSKWFGSVLLVPMLLVQVAILLRERHYISRTHEKLGLEW